MSRFNSLRHRPSHHHSPSLPPLPSPLPILLEYDTKDPDVEAAVRAIGRAIRKAEATKPQNHEALTRAVIDNVKHLTIFGHHKKVYGLLKSPSVRRLVAFNWKYVSPLGASTNSK